MSRNGVQQDEKEIEPQGTRRPAEGGVVTQAKRAIAEAEQALADVEGELSESEKLQKSNQLLLGALTRISKVESEISAVHSKLNAVKKAHESLSIPYKQLAEEKIRDLNKTIEIQTLDLSEKYTKLGDIESSAEVLLGSISDKAVSTNHKQQVEKESRAAWGFQIAASLCFLGVAAFVGWMLYSTKPADIHTGYLVFRAVTVLTLLIPGFYFARQATYHRHQASHMTRITLGMNAIGPYTSEFEEHERLELKREFARSMFLDPIAAQPVMGTQKFGLKGKNGDTSVEATAETSN